MSKAAASGVVALIFLVLGFQAAIFTGNVFRYNREHRVDTVYVVQEEFQQKADETPDSSDVSDGQMSRMKVLLPDAQSVPSFANAGRKSLHGLGCNMPVTDNDQYIMYWLELFGAENLAHRNYNTLSSGEQRYILLIRAFVKDPDLLILDEPFQGLDPERRHRAAAVVEAFCARSNKTLVFVTHYIEEIPGIVTNTLQL